MTKGSFKSWITFSRFRNPAPVVGVVRLSGIIGQVGPMRRGLSLTGLAEALDRVFKLRHLKAVALAVNSPGGSPVQSALIAERIRALAEEKDVPVLAFAEDVAASGGYWLSCAADEIYAMESSIIGSIGVVSAGFGFTDLIEKLGVERRLYTAGPNKARLDPFQAERSEDVAHLKDIQADLYETFTKLVKDRRQEKLKEKEETLFSGDFWTGKRALDMGLIDGIGDMRSVMRERFGERVKFKKIEPARQSIFKRLSSPGSRAPADPMDWGAGVLAAVEERLMWNRFGL